MKTPITKTLLDKKEAAVLATIITVKCLFLAYIYFGATSPIPKRDALLHTYMILTSAKNNIIYTSWKYPPLFIWIWSIIPYITGVNSIQEIITYVLLLSFINQILAIIFYYQMVKELYSTKSIALLSTLFWLFVSGFGWTYLITNKPQKLFCLFVSSFEWTYLIINKPPKTLTDGEVMALISRIAHIYGNYAGAYVSPTYTDCHTLVRLLSLALFFLGITLLNKALKTSKNKYCIQVAIVYTAITAGHLIEAPNYGLAAATAIALHKPDKNILKKLLITSIVSSLVATTIILYKHNFEWTALPRYLACLSYTAGIILGIILKKVLKLIKKIVQVTRIEPYSLMKIGTIILVYFYGLSIIAFKILTVNKRLGIYCNYSPQWYMYPIEWGFIGLYTIIGLAIIISTKTKISYGLKFTIIYIALTLLQITILNTINYHITFITYPYPTEPILILPFLATVAAHTILLYKKRKTKTLFYILMFLALSLGTIDTLLSANYWRLETGPPGCHISLTTHLKEILNYLIKTNPNSSLILTQHPPYHLTSFMIRLSGYSTPPYSVTYVYWTSENLEELKLIYSSIPVDFILVDKKGEVALKGILTELLKNTTPIIENEHYILYRFPLKSPKASPILSQGFVRISKINFTGSIIIKNINKTLTGSGEIKPLNNSLLITVNNKTLTITANKTKIAIKGNIMLHNISSLHCFNRKPVVDLFAKTKGELVFQTIIATKSHLYITNVDLRGTIKFKQHYQYATPQERIKDYVHTRQIPVTKVITTKQGTIWTTLYTLIIYTSTQIAEKTKIRIILLYIKQK